MCLKEHGLPPLYCINTNRYTTSIPKGDAFNDSWAATTSGIGFVYLSVLMLSGGGEVGHDSKQKNLFWDGCRLLVSVDAV